MVRTERKHSMTKSMQKVDTAMVKLTTEVCLPLVLTLRTSGSRARFPRRRLIFILIPKYYICQNHNMKLYVSVYHHHPPPVLPWQLPNNFDLKSVKLRSYVLEGTGEYQPYLIHLKPVKLTRVDHKE